MTLALLFGLFNLFFGTAQIVRGIEARHTGRIEHPVLETV